MFIVCVNPLSLQQIGIGAEEGSEIRGRAEPVSRPKAKGQNFFFTQNFFLRGPRVFSAGPAEIRKERPHALPKRSCGPCTNLQNSIFSGLKRSLAFFGVRNPAQ